jgi:hypothetical protein
MPTRKDDGALTVILGVVAIASVIGGLVLFCIARLG